MFIDQIVRVCFYTVIRKAHFPILVLQKQLLSRVPFSLFGKGSKDLVSLPLFADAGVGDV